MAAVCLGQDTPGPALLDPEPAIAETTGDGAESWSAVRTWHDRTGKSSVEAKLIDVSDDSVRLLKVGSDRVISVPLEKLSIADREYCAIVLKRLSGEELDGDAVESPAKPLESQFQRGERAVMEALEEREATVEAIETERPTSAVVATKVDAMERAFSEAVQGQPLRVDFVVRDVEQLRNGEVMVSFSNCNLDVATFSSGVRLRMSPADWRKITRGSVIRFEGKVNERSRRAIAALDFRFGTTNPMRHLNGYYSYNDVPGCSLTLIATDFRLLREDEVAEPEDVEE